MGVFGRYRIRGRDYADGADETTRLGARIGMPPLRESLLPVWTPFSWIDFHRDFLRLVDRELAATGLPRSLAVEGVAVVTVGDRDTVMDLRGLAQSVAPTPLREWPAAIREAVRQHVAAEQAAGRFLEHPPSAADAGPLLALRLISAAPALGIGAEQASQAHETSRTGDADRSPVRRPVTEDLAMELVYDLPTTAVAVPASHVTAWGGDADALFDLALTNTRSRVRAVVAQAGTMRRSYDVLRHASPFTASALLCLDELVGPLTPFGVLVAVPSRHELVAHVITDSDRLAQALADLPAGVRRRHARVAVPLSPRLYSWRGSDEQATWPRFMTVAPGSTPDDLTARPHHPTADATTAQ